MIEVYCLILACYPADNHIFIVNNSHTRTRCEICSKLTIKIPERRPGIFIVNFEHISHLALEFLLLTLSRSMPPGKNIDLHNWVLSGSHSNLNNFAFKASEDQQFVIVEC